MQLSCAEIASRRPVSNAVAIARFRLLVARELGRPHLVAVVAGTTLGMLIADVPVVWLGGAAAARIPLRAVRLVAAGLFVALAIVALVSG